jgi:hypothetical protein
MKNMGEIPFRGRSVIAGVSAVRNSYLSRKVQLKLMVRLDLPLRGAPVIVALVFAPSHTGQDRSFRHPTGVLAAQSH